MALAAPAISAASPVPLAKMRPRRAFKLIELPPSKGCFALVATSSPTCLEDTLPLIRCAD